ncbi:translation initiation factor IF-2-like isoform X2 [Gadus chalcogrammus]|uniref:translation initiation factor IF-2-like isoform X2 n=1 Tax=Gadus chalcogrammus TaxID=1042646 RepID=UPI0024C4CA97|nr:translation initiation factor IF-2-like isoform X2 [Gadus chalcogrammus]
MVIIVYLSRHLVTDSGEGLQPEGLQPEGLHQEGLQPEGLQPEGLQPVGLLQDGLLQREGLYQGGLQPEGPQPEGLQAEGLQEEGLHQEDLNQEGPHQEGLQPEGLQPESLHQEGLQQEGLHQEGQLMRERTPMVRTPGVLEAEEDALELEMPTDNGNHHVVVCQRPIDAVVLILNQDQPPATALPGEEPVQEPKRKSLGWRFFNWLCVVKEKEPNNKRNAGTYLKEDTEEHLISSKADKRREQKEAQRLKEEQRYEQWAAERGLSDAGEGPADGPKKRMTRLQKVSLGLVTLCQ